MYQLVELMQINIKTSHVLVSIQLLYKKHKFSTFVFDKVDFKS